MQNELIFKYIFDKGYNPKYVNGAISSVSSTGDIVVNFYLERMALPNKEMFNISNEGKLEQIETFPEDMNKSIVRYVENGIVLNLGSAKVIRDLLDRQIKALEENQKR